MEITIKHVWRNFVRVRNLQIQGLNITEADSFNSIMVGMQFRHYPYASSYRNGVFLAAGYAYEHGVAYFSETVNTQDNQTDIVKKVHLRPTSFRHDYWFLNNT